MTGPENYQEAQEIITQVLQDSYDTSKYSITDLLAMAQVHATLALAAATAIDPDTQRADWREVAGNPG
jgi:hypothetical protein